MNEYIIRYKKTDDPFILRHANLDIIIPKFEFIDSIIIKEKTAMKAEYKFYDVFQSDDDYDYQVISIYKI